MICGDKGLKGQAENMRRLPHFSIWTKLKDPSVNDLLKKIEPKYLNSRRLENLEKIIDRLHECGHFDKQKVVLSICIHLFFQYTYALKRI